MGLALEVGGNSHCYVFSCAEIEIKKGKSQGAPPADLAAAWEEFTQTHGEYGTNQNYQCKNNDIILTVTDRKTKKLLSEFTLKGVANIKNVGTINNGMEQQILATELESENFAVAGPPAENAVTPVEKIPAVRQYLPKQKLSKKDLAALSRHYHAENYFEANCILMKAALEGIAFNDGRGSAKIDYYSLAWAAADTYGTLTNRFRSPGGDGFWDTEFHEQIKMTQEEIAQHRPLSEKSKDYFQNSSSGIEYYKYRHNKIGQALTRYETIVNELDKGNKFYLTYLNEKNEEETVYFKAEKSLTEELLALNNIKLQAVANEPTAERA